MPPKKKGKGKKKKGGDDGEMEVKFKQSQHEVDALKDQMAYRRELSRRSLAVADNYREQIQEAQKSVDELQKDMKDVSSGLTQQYKTMQMELGFKITQLEMELGTTKTRLNITDQELSQQRLQYEKMQRDKDAHIKMLDGKISNLETSFENLIDIGFNNILTKLNEEKQKWDIKMDTIFDENKRSLRNLNLIHLEV
jgi:membrane-associated HD superfamily phosphohydrolase